jgi:hypothetical protein
MEASVEFKTWVTDCIDLYFEYFHPRWTVLHAATLDARTDSVWLVVTVIMIGCWFGDTEASAEEISAVHERVVRWVFGELVSFVVTQE